MEFSSCKGGGGFVGVSSPWPLIEIGPTASVSLSLSLSPHTSSTPSQSYYFPLLPSALALLCYFIQLSCTFPLCLLCAQLSYALLATNQDATRAVGGEASWGSACLTRLATGPDPCPSCYPPNCVIKKLKANSCTTTQRTTLSKDDA